MSETLREKINSRMKALGIEAKRSLGQNFLVSENVVEKILAAALPKNFSHVYEIGPGLGALTDELAAQSQQLTLIELDSNFSQFWQDKGFEVFSTDALTHPWEKLKEEEGAKLLVSNLPYQISSRLVVDLSLKSPNFSRMVLMFQKEVAQRIVATPGGKEYGLLSVVAQVFWRVRFILEAGSVDFMPKPNVASRVLCFDSKPSLPEGINPHEFLTFLKLCFANRRKKLLPKLTEFHSREELGSLFSKLSFGEEVRVEKLSPQNLIDLYIAIKSE